MRSSPVEKNGGIELFLSLPPVTLQFSWFLELGGLRGGMGVLSTASAASRLAMSGRRITIWNLVLV